MGTYGYGQRLGNKTKKIFALGLEYLQEVFNGGAEVVKIGNDWVYPNHDNILNLKVKATPVLTLDGSTNYGNTNEYIVGQQPINITIEFTLDALPTSTGGLFNCGSSNSDAGISAYMINGSNIVYCTVYGDLGNSLLLYKAGAIVGKNVFTFQWNGLTGSNITIDINGNTDTKIATDSWVGDSSEIMRIGSYNLTGNRLPMKVTKFEVENLFKFLCLENSGEYLYSENSNSTIRLIGTDTFWDNPSDEREPLLLTTYSYTSFQKLDDSTKYINIIYENDSPKLSLLEGYRKVSDNLPNTGFTNTGNSLEQPANAEIEAVWNKYNIPFPIITYSDLKAINLVDEGSNITVVKYGGNTYIRTPFNATQDLVQTFRAYTDTAFTNSFIQPFDARLVSNTDDNLEATLKAGVLIHSSGDDAAPNNYNGAFIGANHGVLINEITANNHGKTNEDIGSEWIDSNSKKFYIVRIIDVNKLWVLAQNEGTLEKWSIPNTLTGATLTHVENATHTSTINIDSTVLIQMYPSIKKNTESILLNGEIQLSDYSDGTVIQCNYVDLIDVNDIINPASMLNNLIANVGSSDEPDFTNGDSQISNDITWRVFENGSITLYYNWEVLQDLDFNYIGMIQSLHLTQGFFPNEKLYLPKVLPISDGVRVWDFESIEDFNTYPAIGLIYNNNYWIEASNPPDREVNILADAGDVNQVAFESGFSLVNGLGNQRKDLANNPWIIWSTGKSYPRAIDSKTTINISDQYSGVCFRKYYDVSTLTNATTFSRHKENDDIYVTFDYHTNVVNDKLTLPTKYDGFGVEVIESKNATIGSTIINSEIDVTIVNNYGYATIKLIPRVIDKKDFTIKNIEDNITYMKTVSQ